MRIAILDDYQGVALSSADWSPVTDRAEVVSFPDHVADPAALAERLADVEVVVAMRERTPFPAETLARLPRLRLLVTTGMANAAIDLGAAAAQGVLVCGTHAHVPAAAEHTWALLMAVLRHIPAEDAAVRAGGWQHTIGEDLSGSTIGLLGLGRLGQRVARYAAAFDMTVLAWSQNLTDDTAAEHGARRVGRIELFERADVVSIHLKLSERSRGLVGPAELAALGPRGYLVNTSRGPIVDEAALIAALQAGTIAGAGLDVFDQEPLAADHPLRRLPNTVVTPHLGYVTRASYAAYFDGVVGDIAAWLAGSPVRVLT